MVAIGQPDNNHTTAIADKIENLDVMVNRGSIVGGGLGTEKGGDRQRDDQNRALEGASIIRMSDPTSNALSPGFKGKTLAKALDSGLANQ